MPRWILFPALGLGFVLGLAALTLPARAQDNCIIESFSTVCGDYYEGKCIRYDQIPNKRCEPAGPAGGYGAIAYGAGTTAVGWAYDQPDASAAEKVAMRNCAAHGGDCSIVLRFPTGCGAVATSGRTVGAEQGGTQQEAEDNALTSCRRRGGGRCEIQAWSCD